MGEVAMKQRDAWLDNAKGVLMLMVVTGHLIAGLTGNAEWIWDLYLIINSSHMLLFTFITGYLQKKRVEQKEYGKLINRLLLPYFVLQFIYYLVLCVNSVASGEFSDGQSLQQLIWLRPIYLLWFLCTIFLCSIIASVLPYKEHPVICLAGAYLVSWLCILLPEISYLRLTKMMAYFAIYLTGCMFDKRWMMELRNNIKIRAISYIVVILWWTGIVYFEPYIFRRIFSMATSYWLYPVKYQGWYGILARPVFQILGMIFSFCFLAIMPRRKGIFTKLGQRSMYIFALHGIVTLMLRTCSKHVFPIYHSINTVGEYIVFGVCIVGLTYFLASDFVYKLCRFALEPNVDWGKLIKRITKEDTH